MDSLPLVSVICISYNQKAYVKEAIRSVAGQTYPNIELIVVDDASTDGSQEEIAECLRESPEAKFIALRENKGNCYAFNRGFRESQGAFIIDLAADDILLPKRVEVGVTDFLNAGEQAGVYFSDAFLIDRHGSIKSTHYDRDADGQIREDVPHGDVYKALIQRYFINPATMMIRREVLEQLGGYDEALSYEDFDFWIRSARDFRYLFNRAPLIKKRELKNSLSSRQTALRNRHQHTTFRVCEKILQLNRTKEEHQALVRRCHYEIRQCLKTGNIELIFRYLQLKSKAKKRKAGE